MTSLLRHLLEYHQQLEVAPKAHRFTANALALLHALAEVPKSSVELAKTLGVGRETVQRIISRLNERHGGIEIQSFGRSAPTLYWKSENFDSIYDEI